MKKSLENHPIWDKLDEALEQIDIEHIAMRHLESCHYKLSSYWTEDEFYEEIALIGPIRAEVVSMSIGKTKMKHSSYRNYWIRLQFALERDISSSEYQNSNEDCDIGELVLILSPDLEIIDENWSIDIESPFVIARHESEKRLPTIF